MQFNTKQKSHKDTAWTEYLRNNFLMCKTMWRYPALKAHLLLNESKWVEWNKCFNKADLLVFVDSKLEETYFIS